MNFHLSANNLTVYFVEPSSAQAKFIVGQLNEVGISKVSIFKDGETALKEMHEHSPDLVISALHLKDMEGTDLADRMREDELLKGIAFILITSETDMDTLDPILQAGACVLHKPFELNQLTKAISATLAYLNIGSLNIAGDEFNLESIRILVADDSSSSRSFIKNTLETIGVNTVVLAQNGKEAAEILSVEQFDIVITDYNMPEMDGKELVQFIRTKSWQSSVPVIMITSDTNQERLAAAKEAGVTELFKKPFDAPMIKTLIEKILSN